MLRIYDRRPRYFSGIHTGSEVYLQMPGEHVLTGTVRYYRNIQLPLWLRNPTEQPAPYNSQESVLIQLPTGDGFFGELRFLHNKMNSVREYRCYVRTENNVILGAFLSPFIEPLAVHANPRVYVRISGQNHTIFTGILQRADGYRPDYIP